MEGHPYPGRLSDNESRLLADLSGKNVKPRDILSTLKKENPENVSTLKTIYNAKQKIRRNEHAGNTEMQCLLSSLKEGGYIFYYRANNMSNELEDLFFIHPSSLEIWRAFPQVMLMDATYKTNKYNMPLLEIVGVSSTHLTFCIAFVFMHQEKEFNYTWALNCLKSTIEECLFPQVIVTDRELALMKACKNVFPDAKQLLCRWHIYQSVWRKSRPSITSEESMFNSMFNQEQPSRRSNFNHVLMNEITSEFHPYITNIQNVDSDGHCGFRAVAASLGFGEENWRRIRSDLHNELLSHPEEYRAIYDVDVYSVNHSLDFYGSTTPQPYWMIMSDTSFLIANTYGVIVHYLSKKGSSTCFPLWSGPQDIINHATVVISHVYGVHYVKVELQVGCPMPTVLQLWRSYRSSRAAGWETMYSGRLNAYVPPNAPRNSSDIDRVNVSDDC